MGWRYRRARTPTLRCHQGTPPRDIRQDPPVRSLERILVKDSRERGTPANREKTRALEPARRVAMPNQAKFNELVLYILRKTEDDPEFGRTKVAKALFYGDFEAYAEHGESITGAVYERRPHGPFPRQLVFAELDLVAQERADPVVPDEAHYEREPYETRNRIVPTDDARIASIPDWQIGILDRWTERVQAATAREYSNLSHKHPGWVLAGQTGVEIPLHTVFLSPRKPPPEAVEHGRRLIREYGWERERT